VLTAKTEETRLDRSAQTDVDQTEIRAQPAIETRNRAQVGRHMPKNWQSLPQTADRNAIPLQRGLEDVLLGECRFKVSTAE